jgi:hypothetical protein
LSYSELQELWLGVGYGGSLFSGEEALREAWTRGRAVVMRLWGGRGRRPMAWWYLEGGDLHYPGYFHERSYLYERGILSESERAGLEREWQVEFDAVQGKDARTRREAYVHHDIPPELIEAWTAERRRRPRAVRNLTVEAQEKAPDAAIEGQEKSMSFRPELSTPSGVSK